jgi:hypothetical protein
MRQNQTGTLERFSLDVLISKLEINLELVFSSKSRELPGSSCKSPKDTLACDDSSVAFIGIIHAFDPILICLERFSLDVLISKLEINLELHNGGEFILTETTTILGKGTTALDLDGIMRGAVNLIVGTKRHMRMGSNAAQCLYLNK